MVSGLFNPLVALNLCPLVFQVMMVLPCSLALVAKSYFFLPYSTMSFGSKIAKSHTVCLFSHACSILLPWVIRMGRSSSSLEKLKQGWHTFTSCSSFHGVPWLASSIADALVCIKLIFRGKPIMVGVSKLNNRIYQSWQVLGNIWAYRAWNVWQNHLVICLKTCSKASRPSLMEIEPLVHCSCWVWSSFDDNTVRRFLGLDEKKLEDIRPLADIVHWQ